MSALKDLRFKNDEDGELPTLVTGREENLEELLQNTKCDGGVNIVSEEKVAKANLQQESDGASSETSKIPVTIITGYLGSGKSTLLEMIAMKGSDRKIAVILNEFGESSEIEKAMTIRNGSASYEEWLDLGNGCLCCSLKNVGVKAIENMIQRSPGNIDYILLETSGIADPAPIAKMFWQDEGLNSSVYIDGIITVLDCEHILKCLDDTPERLGNDNQVALEDKLTIAHYQIAMADRIIMNKFDKVEHDSQYISRLERRIGSINAEAPIFYTKYGDLDLYKILDLHAFQIGDVINTDDKALSTVHDPRMTTVTINFRPLRDEKEYETFIKSFLQVLLWKSFGVSQEDIAESAMESKSWEIQRTKGLILVGNGDSPKVKVIQGVRESYDVFPGELLPGKTTCKLVLIGKYLDKTKIELLLNKVLR